MVERLDILSLAPQELGDSVYTTCPSCGGKGKFSISRLEDETVLYHCFRASCQLHGGGAITPNGARTLPSSVIRMTHRTSPFDGELTELPIEQVHLLAAEAGFTDKHLQIARPMWAADLHRIAFPILSPMGTRDGWCLRSYQGGVPKALTKMEVERHSHSYYGNRGGWCVVVEDIPSAVRASVYMDSVALLGTGLSNDGAIEVAAHRPNVIFALDADATAQALRLQKRHRLFFNQSSVIMLDKDLKDMEERELRDFLEALTL